MNNKEKFQTVLIFVFVLVLLFIAVSLSAQTNPFVHSITKEKSTGRELKSNKDCISVSVTENDIIFIVSGTTYQAFQRNGTDRYGAPAWEDVATRKRVDIVVQKDGTICIWKTEKKAFCYTPNKKVQQ